MVIVLDYGSQYTQLLARRIRECGVYCEIYPASISKHALLAHRPKGLILSGGPASTTHRAAPKAPAWLFELDLPLLGICYGMQAMAVTLGGRVESSAFREYGYAKAVLSETHPFFLQGMQDGQDTLERKYLNVWMSHGDSVTALPPDFKVLATTEHTPIAAMAHNHKPWFGLQFHPEVTHTPQGRAILSQFVLDICHERPEWTPASILSQLTEEVRAQVGSERVLLGISGGVDSSVVAALLQRAIGSNLQCMFIDSGLLRQGEVAEVKTLFAAQNGLSVHFVNAQRRFLTALEGVSCPEEKRKRIGHTFIEVFQEESLRFPGMTWLAQGTIYPDVIESASTTTEHASQVIKSHHNVGGLPKTLPFKLLEPIRTLFKDEVRTLGMALGLPAQLLDRHPFPGPGLAVRVLGEVRKEFIEIVRQADAIFIQALREAGLYQKVSQAFAVFLPIRSVGVMGDGRTYDYVICLRAVTTQDFMTAEAACLPWEFLDEVARRIMNQVHSVSRVVYDISGKPPATIEWE